MAKPILKWAGGKAALLPQIKPFLPDSFQNYIEPFFGGGAVFWVVGASALGYKILSDLNPEIINLYQVVRNDPHKFISFMKDVEGYYHSLDPVAQKEHYLEIRNEMPGKGIYAAARTLFLNKTGFNGLYRLNKAGEFNVPHGRSSSGKPVVICDASAILAASAALQGARLAVNHFQWIEGTKHDRLDDAFVYLDPPYHPVSKTSSFTGYQSGGFSEQDQRDVAELFKSLADRGAKVALSNSDCGFTRSLYAGYRIEPISRSGSISCKKDGRGKVSEILVLSY